jgi:uncharacterized protein (DUF1684 family)
MRWLLFHIWCCWIGTISAADSRPASRMPFSSLSASPLHDAFRVKLRYFAGLTLPEAAEVLGISTPTAERHWAIARVWLFREIRRQKDGQGA